MTFLSAVRLIAASITGRMNFNVDEIEDVKAAVSKAYASII